MDKNNLIDEQLSLYLTSFQSWVCNKYSVSIAYVGLKNKDSLMLLDASINLNPIPFIDFEKISVETEEIVAGQIAISNLPKIKLDRLINRAIEGQIETIHGLLTLPSTGRLTFHTELINRGNWVSDLHLKIIGDSQNLTSPTKLIKLDNSLRCAIPPFDGLADLCRWLSLSEPYNAHASITLRANPPVDLILSECSFQAGRLKLLIRATKNINIKNLSLSLRPVPGKTISRKLVQNEIPWRSHGKGIMQGVIELDFDNVDAVLAVLMLEQTLVRRQWFEDPLRATNYRLIATQVFDKDLENLKQALFPDSNKSREFEKAVATLFYIFGFNQIQPLGTDGPDIIASTPRGQIIVVECTLKISDAHTKFGKLVQRRGAVIDALKLAGHSTRKVIAMLVCPLNRDQIPVIDSKEWSENKILLITKTDIEELLYRIRSVADPDDLLDEVINSSSKQSQLF